MSKKGSKAKDVVKLDTETILQTTEGRFFLNQLNEVSHVLAMRDTEVEFKGEPLVKTGYVGDYKSVHLYKCPNGYFLFFDKAFGKNNESATGKSLDDIYAQISDKEVKRKIEEEMPAVSA